MLAAFLTPELIGDIAYWVVFFVGTCVWVFICATAAIRSRHNPVASRWEYFEHNWDIYAIRLVTVDLTIYLILRHYSINDALALLGQTWKLPGSGAGVMTYFFAGLGSDSLVAFALKSKNVPGWLRKWVQEKIPELPQEVIATVETTAHVTIPPAPAADKTKP